MLLLLLLMPLLLLLLLLLRTEYHLRVDMIEGLLFHDRGPPRLLRHIKSQSMMIRQSKIEIILVLVGRGEGRRRVGNFFVEWDDSRRCGCLIRSIRLLRSLRVWTQVGEKGKKIGGDLIVCVLVRHGCFMFARNNSHN